MDHRWSNDDYGNGSYRTSVFTDVDGTVTGVPNSFILINDEPNAIAIDRSCEVRPTWNAAVCTGDIGRLAVNAPGPAGGNPPLPGAPAGPPRVAAAGPGGPAAPSPAPRPAAAPAGPPPVFGRPAGPPPPPVVVSGNGAEFTLAGDTNIRAGSEIKVVTERPAVALRLSELDPGSWVIFQLPGFTTAASGTPQDSLEALRAASVTSTTEATMRSG
jgi:cell migration-inducing and hyaluronan-binding protein